LVFQINGLGDSQSKMKLNYRVFRSHPYPYPGANNAIALASKSGWTVPSEGGRFCASVF